MRKPSSGINELRQLKEKIWRFVAMLLLRNKDQQQNNPLLSFATCPKDISEDMSELQALITTWHQNSEPGSCPVCVT